MNGCFVTVSEKLVASRVRTDSPEGGADSEDSELTTVKMKRKKKMQPQIETLEAIAKR